MCGLRIEMRGEEVMRIRPNKDDVFSKGHICPKGTTLGQLHADPNRLRGPVVRDPGSDTFREVSWDEAFETCERLLHAVIAEHGRESLIAYVGNPVAHTFSLARYLGLFFGFTGIPNMYSAGTVDQWPKNVTAALMYGGMWDIPIPDLQRSAFAVFMGANPQASNGSLMGCPDILGELDRIRAGGGEVIVIDPRRTGTARKATEWVPILPGTDAALLLAVVQVLFAEDLVQLGALADHVNGLDELRALSADHTPERVARTCRVPADRIRRLARQIAAAESGVVYGRIGLCNQEFGTLSSWLIDVVNILTGSFDVPGGLMFTDPVNWTRGTLPPKPGTPGITPTFGTFHSRVRGAPEVFGQIPISCMAEEIDTPGEGQAHGLITFAGNPALSAPGSERLAAALPMLGAMISIDNWVNETTRHAHVILPGLSALEQPHFDDMGWKYAVRNAGKWSDAILPPADDRPAEWEIMVRLAGIIQGSKASEVDVAALDDRYFLSLLGAIGLEPEDVLPRYSTGGPERILDLSIHTGAYGDWYGRNPGGVTLEAFRDAPDGLDFGALQPRIPQLLRTESGRIELAPPYITDDLPRLAARLERDPSSLVMVSRRHLRSNNSWLHQVPALMGGTNRCTLLMNPKDAADSGVTGAAMVRVTSESGSVDVALEETEEMMPGVVSLPHGWGHTVPGAQPGVAPEHAGVNANLLAPSRLVDVPSGNAVVNGFPVTVTAVA